MLRLLALCACVLAIVTAVGCGGSGASGTGGTTAAGTTTGGTSTGGSSTGGTTGGSSGIASYLLVGGTAKPAQTDVYLDSDLDTGELFIIPKAALGSGLTYRADVTADTSTEHFTATLTFTTGGMSTTKTTALEVVNELRGQAGESAIASHAALVTSSSKHAGYQAIDNAGITHYEPNTGNALYVANQFYDRIFAANGGGWITGTNTVGEDISSAGGATSVLGLWNTVYHRLPMMRSSTTLLGFGDEAAARSAYSSAGVPASGNGYATFDFAGDTGRTVIASQWPGAGSSDVEASFQNQYEFPHPIGYGNANGTTPDAATVGPPLHCIFPTSKNFISVSVNLTKQ